MNDLIKINQTSINGADVNSVNAREIHTYLEVKTKFADWIKRAIEKYDFVQDEDYSILKNGNGNNAFIDYIVTLDMAKELCMLENNPKGKETRKYFITFEKKAKAIINSQSTEIQLMKQMITTLEKTESRVTTLEQTKRLEAWQEKALQDAKNQKVYEIANKYDLINDKAMIKKLHSRIWKKLKNYYNVPRYTEICCIHYEEAKNIILNIRFKDLF